MMLRVAVLLAVVQAETTPSCESCNVQIKITSSSTFRPTDAGPYGLFVAVGECVCWTNEDATAHSVQTAQGTGAFSSGVSGGMAQGQEFVWSPTAENVGEHAYYCEPHTSMTE